MTAALFDPAPADTATHACAGDACQVCRMDAVSRPEPREGRARHTDPALRVHR